MSHLSSTLCCTRLSAISIVLLHPDKQTDEAHRQLANEQFQRVKQAYQVLSDPQKRSIYDEFGEAGIQYASQVGQKLKTTEEVSCILRYLMHAWFRWYRQTLMHRPSITIQILAEIERLSRNRTLQGRSITSQNNAQVNVDARSFNVFSRDTLVKDMSIVDRLSDVAITGFSLGHTLNVRSRPCSILFMLC